MSTNYPLERGDGVYLVCATGGGYGSPLTRPVDLVWKDVWNEKVSVEFARRAYGVVIDPRTLEVDHDATADLRSALAAKEGSGDWAVPVAGVPTPWPADQEALERRYATLGQSHYDRGAKR
jgi:hypothetical protein